MSPIFRTRGNQCTLLRQGNTVHFNVPQTEDYLVVSTWFEFVYVSNLL